MITPQEVQKMWLEFCQSFPGFFCADDLKSRYAYLTGYRSALEHALPMPGLSQVQQEFEQAMERTMNGLIERQRQHRQILGPDLGCGNN